MVDPQRPNEDDAPFWAPGLASQPPPSEPEPVVETASRRRTLLVSLAAVAALAAVATPVAIHLAHGKPPRLHTPVQLAGLNRDDRADATETADYLQNAVTAGMGLENTVGAVYTDGRGDAHSVIFVGGASADGTETSRLNRIFRLLNDATDGVTPLKSEPAGTLGGTVKCGLATDTESSPSSPPAPPAPGDPEMAVCGWADGQTVGVAMFPNRPVTEAADLLNRMRPGIQGRK
jgi:hypothetical protein